jgi:uncharacterized protein YndB with AHSA1/START domain
MAGSSFVYVTYIRTTTAKLWRALLEPEFTRQYWVETHQESAWQVGSEWKLMIPDGRVGDSGQVLEIVPEKKLVVSWQNQFQADLIAETPSRCTYELEAMDDMVKLTVTHEHDLPNSKLIAGVSTGWPMILASLKSLLETGESLEQTRHWPKGM